jgi:hypothetical protein
MIYFIAREGKDRMIGWLVRSLYSWVALHWIHAGMYMWWRAFCI